MSATATRKLFVNFQTKSLQISDRNGGNFALPAFNKYETIPFEIVIVEADLNSQGLTKYTRMDISTLSLSVAINQTYDSASPLAYQPTFAKNEQTNVFSAELALNTAAFNSYLGASDTKPAFFEIEIQEATARTKVYVEIVTLKNAVTQVGGTVPSPVDEYLTKAQTVAQFMPRIGEAGGQQTFTSPGNIYQRIIGVTDDGSPIDQILAV